MKNEKGIATIESVLLMSIFVVFMTYCVGMFGVVHTGILNSISARAYLLETMRNRANVVYFLDDPSQFNRPSQTLKYGMRANGITTETSSEDFWNVTTREITKGRDVSSYAQRPTDPQAPLFDKAGNNRELGKVNPVWIKTIYGICLDYKCGGGA